MNKKQEAELHKIALRYKVRDSVAKLIVESPFLFMRKTIESLDVTKLEKTNFYHKKLGRFYLKTKVLEYIIKNLNKKNEQK